MRFLITGGAGFIGSNFVRHLLKALENPEIIVYDKLSYAGRIENINEFLDLSNFRFVKGDINNEGQLYDVLKNEKPDVIVNFAAETHVDRSINEPAPFIKTNIIGVFNLLELSRKMDIPLLVHISTDEVYGDRWDKPPADEETAFKPSSPYSASKASADLFCQAYWRTYRVPVIIVRPSNNYGPYQFPEKLIPKVIIRALYNKPIPVYGKGDQVRDWLYVEDFSDALLTIIFKGKKGEAYNVPGFNEKRNLDVIKDILSLMNKPSSLIRHVEDRPGHDRKYSMKGDKILSLGWKPKTEWLVGLKKTIDWYINNKSWWEPLLTDEYFTKDVPWKNEIK